MIHVTPRRLEVTLLLVALLVCAGGTRRTLLSPKDGSRRAGAAALRELDRRGLTASLQAAYTAARYAIRTRESGRSFVAHNPDQGYEAQFSPARLDLSATAAGTSWRLAVTPAALGRATAATAVSEGTIRTRDARVEIARTAGSVSITEWFVNEPSGLEQGFTIHSRPAGAASAPLRLTLAVDGTLRPRLAADGQSLAFTDAAGAEALRYDHLRVFDSTGAPLHSRFDAAADTLTIVVDDERAVYPVTIDPTWSQKAYLKASNTEASDSFGYAIAISGDTVVVGAPFEDSSATGVNGNQANNSADESGAAYVFVRNGTTWSQQAYLKASNTQAGDTFAWSVAVSGNTIVVGAPHEDSSATGVNGSQADNSASDSGAAYVFVRNGTTWSQQAYLKASNTGTFDDFGWSVAVSGDTIVVGSLRESSDATGVNGSQANDLASSSGAAYVFTRSGTTWSQQAYLKASNTGENDEFGWTVAIDGDTIAVGAHYEDSNATGVDGNQADESALDSGAAYIFARAGTTWSQQAYLKASNTDANDLYGWSVAVSGDTAIVGAPGESSAATGVNGNQADNSAPVGGAAYVYTRSGAAWSQQAYLKASNTGSPDLFGYTVGLSGDAIVVGAIRESSSATGVDGDQSSNAAHYAGAAYAFARTADVWSQQAYLKASNTAANAFFGRAVAVSGGGVAIGSPDESNSATGVDGNQSAGVAGGSGAAYLFSNAFPTLTTTASAGVAFDGGDIHDVATLSSGFSAGGTLTFRLYGPDDPTCSGAPVFTDAVSVNGNGVYTSADFTPGAAGVYRWIASYSGDDDATVAGACNDAGEAVTVAKADQTIDFPAPGGQTYGNGPFAVSATAESALTVSFSSLTTGVCTMADATHVQIVTAGTCTIAAHQGGDGNYNTAPQVTRDVDIARDDQTIDFPAPGGQTYGNGPFAVSATAESALTVSFSSLTTGVCTMADATHVQIVTAGTCTIAAKQGGDGNYNAAPQVTRDVDIARAGQTIDFTPPPSQTFGNGPFAVGATASSMLTVSFSSLTTGVCTMADATHLQIVAAGTCTIAANQIGDGNYTPAPEMTGNVAIGRADQTISLSVPSSALLTDSPVSVSATATSALSVTLTSQTTAVCTIGGTTVTLAGLGTCTIAAKQDGNGNYNAAPEVTRSFTVSANCSLLSLQPGTVRVALAGTPYSQSFSVTGGASPAAFTLDGALPAGLAFSNGAISGTPSGRGAFPITITGTDAHACQVSAAFTLGVSPERNLIAGAGGITPAVRALAPDGAVRAEFEAYVHGFPGGVSVAQGDLNGDGVTDIVTGAGPGGGPHVLVFDGTTHAVRASFFAFDPAFTGGVEVATGDVTGDGHPEILASAGCGGPSVVRAFNGRTGALVREYAAPAGRCRHLAAGDVNGDGIADPIVGAGVGPSPSVTVINGYTGATLRQFLAYADGFPGGVFVAAGDVTGDGLADIVTGAGPGGGPHVRVFDGVTGEPIAGPLASFFAYEPAFPGGVRVAAGDLNGDGRAEVITGAGPGGGPHVRVFDGATGVETLGTFAFDPAFSGGVFLAAPPPIARMTIDLPASSVTGTALRIAGWALKQTSIETNGVDIMNAWALPVGGGAPIFVAGAVIDGVRADVANVFGGEFLTSGFDVTGTLAPGTYDLAVFVRNSRTLLFDQLRIVRITVN